MRESRGGGANLKAFWFLSNTGPIPWKITKLPSQHSIVGHHLPANDTRCFAGGSAFSGLWFSLPNQLKNVSELGPLLQNFLDPRMRQCLLVWGLLRFPLKLIEETRLNETVFCFRNYEGSFNLEISFPLRNGSWNSLLLLKWALMREHLSSGSLTK